MKNLTKINVVGGLTAVVLGAAAPAMASSYYSSSNPLNAYQDGVIQAQMYGAFDVENLTYLRNRTNQRDPRPGGDSVFERTKYSYDHGDGQGYQTGGTDQSAKTDYYAWYSQTDHDEIDGMAISGRIRTQVCEDHGIYLDPCSAWPQQTFGL